MTIIVDVRGKTAEEAGQEISRVTVGTSEHVHVRNDQNVYCPYEDPACAIGARMTLTRENTGEVVAWCGGRRAGGADEMVGLPYPDTRFACPGDTIVRTGETTYDLLKGDA